MSKLAIWLGFCYAFIVIAAALSQCVNKPCPCDMARNHECVPR